ncbi:MAG: DUF763 domain-containing protein [Peptococcaceae bacterium]|nr:DUF763 domain-containing protein [Peptococcaceae bacterium]MDH7525449.1 DUF763 domain-containing protein [Peptococcaceae bacterium]
MRTGIASIPLHGGHCPPWLFEKMKKLGTAIIQVIVYEYGTAEVLTRLSDPVWFQTLGSVLGFDWHSSGLTTVLCGALKEGVVEMQGELGLFFAGGKGRTSRQTPQEIAEAGEKYGLPGSYEVLQRASRMVAKVDSAAVQDGYQLYHHFFAFDKNGRWAVVQQGMNEANRYARRYHWLSDNVKSFVEEPHTGICGTREKEVLNLVSQENSKLRTASVELCSEKPEKLIKLIMPAGHDIPRQAYLNKILYKLYERPPQYYETLLETPGVGASTLRALVMVAEATHGVKPSYQDPVRYAFAHGGKDGFPFPVQRKDYEYSIEVLEKAVQKAKMGCSDRLAALRRLAYFQQNA